MNCTTGLDYKIIEKFKVDNISFSFDYAVSSHLIPDNLNLTVTSPSWYKRRSDLKNLSIALVGFFDSDVMVCGMQFLSDFKWIHNFLIC